MRGGRIIVIVVLCFVCQPSLSQEADEASDCAEGIFPCYDPAKGGYDDGHDDAEAGIGEVTEAPESGRGEPRPRAGAEVVEDGDVSAETLGEWIKEIFGPSLESMRKRGTPGRVFAFGQRAFPILMGEGDTDALMVAAELGRGRIIAVASQYYVEDVELYDKGCLEQDDTKGVRYMGAQTVTRRSRVCQRWDSQTPRQHEWTEDEHYPDATIEDAGNFCRNPDDSPKPWCYTFTGRGTRDDCEIPRCQAPGDNDYDIMQFHTNAKKWLTRGEYEDATNICYVKSSTGAGCVDSPTVKLAVVKKMVSTFTDEQSDKKMLEWVKAGGSLLFGAEGWVWNSYEGKDRPWTDIPFYSVLKEAGIGLTLKYAEIMPGVGYKVDTSPEWLARLHSLNIYYLARTYSSPRDLDEPGDYFDMILDIITKENNLAYTTQLRTAIAEPLVAFIDAVEPEMKWPPCDEDQLSKVVFFQQYALNSLLLYTYMGFLGLWKTGKAPNVENFPGDVANPPAPETVTLKVDSDKQQFVPTGLYLLPGAELTVTITQGSEEQWKQLAVIVGLHTDKLLQNEKWWLRYPIMSTRVPMREGSSFKVRSPFGGTVVISTPGDGAVVSGVELTISGAIQAPQYKLDDPESVRNWMQRRLAPAPWAELIGQHITFYLPAEGIRDLDDPGQALRIWDKTIKKDYDLTGMPEPWRRHQYFIPDQQIVVGALHAGYPIMSHLNSYGYPNLEKWPMHTDNMDKYWGLYHEIGHNIQRNEWTFSGFTETTVNIYSMIALEYTAEIDPLSHFWDKRVNERAVVEVVANKDYEKLESKDIPWTALLAYAQLYTEFGWGCYTEVLQGYENDLWNNTRAIPDKNADEINQWVSRWSNVVQYNLCPMFEFWAYPLTICDDLKGYPPFLPTDEITEKSGVAARVAELAGQYPNLLRELPSKPTCYTPSFALREGSRQEIEESMNELTEKRRLMQGNMPVINATESSMMRQLKDLRLKFAANNIKAPQKSII